uniref:cysteine desulfurase n=1 Tax=candidate division WOR-3 bacterium TaxID=2052148 RepID=A0A7C4GFM9_UNCW3
MRRVYLDNNSTTRLDERVAAGMAPFLREMFGNPSNVHSFGRECAEGLAEARERVARFINAEPEEIFFTSCGTESDNWALKGAALARKDRRRHVVVSAIEHSAVLGSARFLETQGWRVTTLPVDRFGLVSLDDVARAVTEETAVVSVMLANNEIGTIEPVKEIAAVCRRAGAYCHTDAVAAAGKIAVDVQELGVDLLTLSGHKLYGPKGVGALYVRRGTEIAPFIHGGHQEAGMRGGTENVLGIVGMGLACDLLRREWPAEAERVRRLRDRFEREALKRIPELLLNGHPEKRVPNVCHFSVGYVEGEALLVSLDLEGVAVASGSACSAGDAEPSPTVKAIGVPPLFRNSSVRFSFGRENVEEDVDFALAAFERVVSRLRDISPLWKKRGR